MNRNLLILYGAAFFKSQVLLIPVLLLFYLHNGLTVGDYFLFQGIMTLTTILFEMPVGYISDKTSSKFVLTMSLIFLLARACLWLSVEGYYVVLAGEFLYTLSKICYDSIASAYIFSLLKQNNCQKLMGTVYGRFNFIMYLSTAIAAVCGAYFYERFGVKPVLMLEILFSLTALLAVLFLPPLHKIKTNKSKQVNFKRHIKQMKEIIKYVKTKAKLSFMIVYSGLLVAFSNFFFWSIQPLLKLAGTSVVSFGIIMFINNSLRCLASYFAQNIKNFLGLKNMAGIIYLLEVSSLILLAFLEVEQNLELCLGIILFFSCCIALQLAFTINHISRIHQNVLSSVRSLVSSLNMVVARLCTATLMISAKFLLDYFSITTILIVYIGIILAPVGAFLLYKLMRYRLF